MKKHFILLVAILATQSIFANKDNTSPLSEKSFCIRHNVKTESESYPIYPKDSCIRIYTINKSGYNCLMFKRVCGYDTEIAVRIWCKYVVNNVKTREREIFTIDMSLWPYETERMVEWLSDTLYEYGEILDYSVGPDFGNYWGEYYYQAYSIDGNRMFRYDIEIYYNNKARQFYALYYSYHENRVIQKSPIIFLKPDQISFTLGIAENNPGTASSKDVTIQAKITKDGLRGNMNIDKKVLFYKDNRNRIVDYSVCEDCGNSTIIYKKTDASGIIVDQ